MGNTGGTGLVTYAMQTPPLGVTNLPNGTFNNVPAGVYTITATDGNGCTATTSITITEPLSNVQITGISNTTPSCVPGCDAVVTITASGGTSTPAYQYQYGVNGPQPSTIFNGQCAGSYTAIVTDGNGCTATSVHSINAAGGPSWSSVTTVDPLCFGDTSGTITAVATPGTSLTISYSSTPSLTQTPLGSGNFSGAGAGVYTIIATDGNNCTINSTVTISTPAALSFSSVVIDSVACNGGTDGSITVSGAGGITPYSYSITSPSAIGPNATGNFPNLVANTYTVQLTDGNNCTLSSNVVVAQPALYAVSSSSSTNILCNGASTGVISVISSGGTGASVYTISPNVGVQSPSGTFTGLPAGTYVITGTDANACSSTTSVTLTEPVALLLTNVTSTIPTCVPGCDATLTITASGGTGSLTYNNGSLPTPGQPSNVFTSQCAGNYTITVTDGNGCTVTSTHSITAPGSPSYVSVSSSNVLCNGDSNGTATLTTTGGTGGVTISITAPSPLPVSVVQTPAGSGNISGLPAGSYTVLATDVVGCNVSTVVTITQPGVFAYSGVVVDSVDCHGGSDGSITVSTSGGSAPASYSINPAVGLQGPAGTFTNLAAGVYTITATDANNCSTVTTVTVHEPSALSYTGVTVTDVTCFGANNGSIVAAGTGGVAPRVITLLPNILPTTTPPATFSGLGGGTQTVRITDAKGCTLDSVVTVVEPAQLVVDTTTGTSNILCFGDSTGVLVMTSSGGTGGVSYSIIPAATQGPAGTFTGMAPGTYTVTATDANSCTAQTTITLTQPVSAVSITSVTSTPPTCNPGNDGTITVTASGGSGSLQYGKNPTYTPQPTGSFVNLPGGGHIVRAIDANGCFVDTAITLTTPGAPAWTSVTTTPTTCFGDSTGSIVGVATGSSAITYALTPYSGTQVGGSFTNLPAGAYSISASDANNCSVVSAVIVGSAPQLVYNNVTVTNVACNGGATGAIAATFSGGTSPLSMSIAPGPGAPSASPASYSGLGAGVQTLRITDGNGCTRDSVVTITQPAVLTLSQSGSTNILCRGDSTGVLSVTKTGGATGAVSYIISPSYANTQQFPAGTFSNLPAGTYTVTVTDANNCTAQTTITLTQPATNVSVTSVVGVSPSCIPGGDGTITVTATGGTGSLQYNLGSNAPGASNVFTNLASSPPAYVITVTDANGCTVSTSYTLAPAATPVWASVTATNILCRGDSTGVITGLSTGGTGSKTYLLTPSYSNTTQAPAGTFNNLPAGSYIIRATDANNCTVTSGVTLTQPATNVGFASVVSDSVKCFGGNTGSITVTGAGGTGVLSSLRGPFTPGTAPSVSTPPSFTYNNLAAGTYVIRIRDANNCRRDSSITVLQPTPVVLDTLWRLNVLCFGDSTGSITVQSSGGTGVKSYSLVGTGSWNTIGAVSGNFSGLPAATYTVRATDANLCTVQSTITITQPPLLTHSVSSTNVLCFGDTTGTITLSGSGGVSPYSYGLIPNVGSQQSAGVFSGLGASTYTGIVTDSNGCTDTTAPVVITQPTQVLFTSVTQQDVECFGAATGAINAAASGGTGLVTISMTGPTSLPSQPSPASFNNLLAGVYTVTATDANGCTSVTNITLLQNPEILLSITPQEPTCWYSEDGCITFTASGGVSPFTYIFDLTGAPQGPSGQTQYCNLGTGTYVIRAIDALQCTHDTSYVLPGPDPITFTQFEITPTTCLDTEDGKLTVRATGGRGNVYTYSLNPGFYVNTSGLFRDLAPQGYTLRTTDTAGCILDTAVLIPLPNNPLVVSVTKEDLGCHGRGNEGKAEAIASGGTAPYTYFWNSTPVQTSARAVGLYQGMHTVDVVDAAGCLVRDTVVIEPGPCCQEVFLPNAFSPNGDGRNDEFRILSSAGIELLQFEVRNRWGMKVWETNNVRSSWDGNYNGKPAPGAASYHYVLRYKCLTDGQEYLKKGDVTIVR